MARSHRYRIRTTSSTRVSAVLRGLVEDDLYQAREIGVQRLSGMSEEKPIRALHKG